MNDGDGSSSGGDPFECFALAPWTGSTAETELDASPRANGERHLDARTRRQSLGRPSLTNPEPLEPVAQTRESKKEGMTYFDSGDAVAVSNRIDTLSIRNWFMSPWYMAWQLVISVTAFYYFTAVLTNDVAVSYLEDPQVGIECLCTVLLMADCVLEYLVARKRGVRDRTLVLDVISALPFDLITLAVQDDPPGHSYHGVVYNLRLLKLVRVVRWLVLPANFTNPKMTGGFMHMHYVVLPTFVTVLFFASTVYMCFFFHLVVVHTTFDEDRIALNMTTTDELVDSMFWVLHTLSTVGYGPPDLPTGEVYPVIMVLVSSLLTGLVVGQLQDFGAEASPAEQSKEMLLETVAVLKEHNIPPHLAEEVLQFQHHLSRHAVTSLQSQTWMPYAMLDTIDLFVKARILDQVYLFCTLSDQCKRDLALALVGCVFGPGSDMVNAGEEGDSMFIITHGYAEVLQARSEKLVAVLKEGQFFGEVCMVKAVRRTATVRAMTYCDTFMLTYEDFCRVRGLHPELEEKVIDVVESRFATVPMDERSHLELSAPQRLRRATLAQGFGLPTPGFNFSVERHQTDDFAKNKSAASTPNSDVLVPGHMLAPAVGVEPATPLVPQPGSDDDTSPRSTARTTTSLTASPPHPDGPSPTSTPRRLNLAKESTVSMATSGSAFSPQLTHAHGAPSALNVKALPVRGLQSGLFGSMHSAARGDGRQLARRWKYEGAGDSPVKKSGAMSPVSETSPSFDAKRVASGVSTGTQLSSLSDKASSPKTGFPEVGPASPMVLSDGEQAPVPELVSSPPPRALKSALAAPTSGVLKKATNRIGKRFRNVVFEAVVKEDLPVPSTMHLAKPTPTSGFEGEVGAVDVSMASPKASFRMPPAGVDMTQEHPVVRGGSFAMLRKHQSHGSVHSVRTRSMRSLGKEASDASHGFSNGSSSMYHQQHQNYQNPRFTTEHSIYNVQSEYWGEFGEDSHSRFFSERASDSGTTSPRPAVLPSRSDIGESRDIAHRGETPVSRSKGRRMRGSQRGARPAPRQNAPPTWGKAVDMTANQKSVVKARRKENFAPAPLVKKQSSLAIVRKGTAGPRSRRSAPPLPVPMVSDEAVAQFSSSVADLLERLTALQARMTEYTTAHGEAGAGGSDEDRGHVAIDGAVEHNTTETTHIPTPLDRGFPLLGPPTPRTEQQPLPLGPQPAAAAEQLSKQHSFDTSSPKAVTKEPSTSSNWDSPKVEPGVAETLRRDGSILVATPLVKTASAHSIPASPPRGGVRLAPIATAPAAEQQPAPPAAMPDPAGYRDGAVETGGNDKQEPQRRWSDVDLGGVQFDIAEDLPSAPEECPPTPPDTAPPSAPASRATSISGPTPSSAEQSERSRQVSMQDGMNDERASPSRRPSSARRVSHITETTSLCLSEERRSPAPDLLSSGQLGAAGNHPPGRGSFMLSTLSEFETLIPPTPGQHHSGAPVRQPSVLVPLRSPSAKDKDSPQPPQDPA
eukprot:TRINITY_DN29762_c0_g1_i1.p1 TRINITY_DN29762_c0_g1~~TRINITY_DN29762_c0_g1_i1.p1  ORF type:complete len:1522 (+),score=456.99 TRINITY_DN29762_c0_g1_i1:127-4566(+)